MMNSVNVQILGAISDAINSQVLPQIQNVLKPDRDKRHRIDGTFRLRDRNTFPKIAAMRDLGVTL